MPKIVALLTDYGTRDQYAGSLRGAVLAACPDANVVDISHDIRSHAVREAAFVLRATGPIIPRPRSVTSPTQACSAPPFPRPSMGATSTVRWPGLWSGARRSKRWAA